MSKTKKISLALAAIIIAASPLTATAEPLLKGDGTTVNPQQYSIQNKLVLESKLKEAEKYVKEKMANIKANENNSGTYAVQPPFDNDYGKVNRVGQYIQALSNTCGPAAARNLISGYVQYNGGSTPYESELSTALYTDEDGTNFDSNIWNPLLNNYAPGNSYALEWATSSWITGLTTRVMATIDRSNNYNIIANINHSYTSTPIHPVYKNGAAHYVTVYGYNNNPGIYYISDSNGVTGVTYTTGYTNLANSTQARGIIW
ncbi:C39 family peptidase [Clostridium sp.]|uniref:C39 family peptidase n=1 Tax=Clostridium sp. TaxID=1506 RepID=UPI0032167466